MARQSGNKGNVSSTGGGKIRLLWIDADLGGTDDVAQITQAIAHALRPPVQQQSRLPAPAAKTLDGHVAVDEVVFEDMDELPTEAEVEAPRAGSIPKSSKPRKVKDPQILDNLDLVGNDISFADYAKQKSPKNHEKRFLTVLAWFKTYGGKPAIGIDEVYTAYRSKGINWPYGIAEYDAVFRGLLKRDVVKRVAKGGPYSITVAGESELDADTESQ